VTIATDVRPFSWWFTTPLFIGSSLNPVDSSLIATALVPIAHGLGDPQIAGIAPRRSGCLSAACWAGGRSSS
jgi:hypothetical protein